MFGTRDRESPAERRKREKEELRGRTLQLLHLIEDHLTQAHPMRRRHTRRKADGTVAVTVLRESSAGRGGSGIGGSGSGIGARTRTTDHDDKGKEKMMVSRSGSNISERTDDDALSASLEPMMQSGSTETVNTNTNTNRTTTAVCHVGEMVECVEQLNLLWDRVVVFGGKEEIQETFLSLPVIEILLRLLKRHPQSAALHARCAQFLTPLVTENMDAKIRVERAKGVRVFGLAYQQFGPWARSPPKAQQPVLGLESGGQTAILAEGLVHAVADAAAGGGHPQWAATSNEIEKATAESETKNAADVREIRLMLEKHSAFDTIVNLFFALTKSIATCASQYPDEEKYLQSLKQKVNKVIYRPQLVERRLLFLVRHILGYNLLWGGLKDEYDKMRKEFSYLHLVSLPTGHIEPTTADAAAALPLLVDHHHHAPTSAEMGHGGPDLTGDDDMSAATLSSSGTGIRSGSGIGSSASGLKDSQGRPLKREQTELEKKHRLIQRKTREMVRAEIREQKLEQVLCHVQLMEVKIDKLPPDVDKDGFPVRARNPFVVIQQWRWREAPGRSQPALWKSTIERENQSPVWDLRPLGSKESGYVLTPRQGTGHKVRRALSGFVYRRNPVAKAISHFQLWKKKRKATRKKKKAEAFTTVRAVGVAADDKRTLSASGGHKRKTQKQYKHKHKHHDGECDDEHHHHNPKLPTRVKHYVKEHHQKHAEEPRDPAITTVVTEMHNRFRARFFPPLKVSVYDWVAVDHQEFLGRVEIDPAVVYLLEQEVIAGRKRAMASGVTTEGLARANAADVARENARLCNRGRRGSFLREMIDTDMESDEDEERELEELDFEDGDNDDDEVSKRKAKEEKNEDDEKNEDHEKREKKEGSPARGDEEVVKVEEEEKEEAKEEDMNEKAEEKEEERNREERDRDEDQAQRRNERARLQMRANIRRAAGSPEELERLNPASTDADASSEPRGRTGDHQDHPNQKQPQPQPQPPQQQKQQAPAAANDENAHAAEGKEARKRERQEMEREKRERKETEKREREQRKKEEHDRKKRDEEVKRRTRKMSKAGLQVEDATIAKEEEQRGITVVMPLYPGEEERNTPGLERRHAGLCGHIAITLTVTPPHWAANCSTISEQPLPKS
ncbi:uncharacterized protein ACA1_092360 [Acanthamoeba castellanii str. Neff]|uniref:Uncharacterized protein n=1 Tax=Acanthamoeba castellanii (strain ATCC 30010 / Neff) TaxID=1257118 RepID=L8GKK0_ACACF|nr:uncharacterized protein ACA1_092360 [Acanthamoeba castellanii str. Neff]ELR12716.1 hypothetical protein ACA1_092360 [Acanthamoeba castellanii str. Neff]